LPNSFPGPIPAPILSDAVFETPVLLNPLGTTLSIILFAVFSKFPLLKSSTKSTAPFPIS
jgi:hypothetical protein